MSATRPDADDLSLIAHLCEQFLSTDCDAQGWAFLYPDESGWESPDCDVMSRRFLLHVQDAGFDGRLVRALSADEGEHWFTIIGAPGAEHVVAVDWTARQFYNAGHPSPPTDPLLISCPLVFDWPGAYPLEVVSFESAEVLASMS